MVHHLLPVTHWRNQTQPIGVRVRHFLHYLSCLLPCLSTHRLHVLPFWPLHTYRLSSNDPPSSFFSSLLLTGACVGVFQRTNFGTRTMSEIFVLWWSILSSGSFGGKASTIFFCNTFCMVMIIHDEFVCNIRSPINTLTASHPNAGDAVFSQFFIEIAKILAVNVLTSTWFIVVFQARPI